MALKSGPLQVAFLLLVAVAFGGGGSGAGLTNLVVQLTALTLIAFNRQAFLDFFKQAPAFLAGVVGATLLLPLVQSIPLPPSIWQILPGRALVDEALLLFGHDDTWFPMSLEVRRTLLAFLSLLPPLTILVLVWKLPEAQKRQLLMLVTVAGVLVVLLGAQQLATGNRRFMLFAEVLGTDDLQGTFANRNTAGLFLNIALCALIAIYPSGRRDFRWTVVSTTVAIILIIGLVLTRSRSSMTLVIVPLIFFVFRVLGSGKIGRISARGMLMMLLGVGVLGGVAYLASDNQRIQRSLSRFENLEDARPDIWKDSIGSIKRFWPLGSGIGTFDEVFQVDETLEKIRYGRSARAHNEYLETALESGLAGIALLLAWAGILISNGWYALRRNKLGSASVAVFALFAFQSIFDYPLRSQTMLCIAGLMLALLVNPTRKVSVERD